MSHALPRLRSDLRMSEQSSGDGIITVIKDPHTENYFRLQHAAGFIATHLDGKITALQLCKRVHDTFGTEIPERELHEFISTLERNGLLENDKARERPLRTPSRVGGGLLHFRIKLVDPDRFLDGLIQHTRFLFSRAFMNFSIAMVILAMLVTLFNANVMLADARMLVDMSTLPLLIVSILCVVSLHEIAHGLTCKRFGGEVHEMGFMLMYFQPALYCNVSDAWLFAEKRKRLLVAFAGPWFELFLWALATIAWRVLAPGTWLAEAALIVIAVAGLRTLMNFNPLIKLDGYYLLSDFLDIHNLRKRSFTYVGESLKKLVGAGNLPAVTTREKKIFLVYGVMAWVFSVALITWFGMAIGEYLVIEQQRLAFLAFTGLISIRFRDRFASLFGRRSHSGNGGSGKKWHARIFNGKPPRWSMRGLVAFAVFAVLVFGQIELRVAGEVVVLPQHNADVRAAIDGTVEKVFVDEGDVVKEGDLIARLSAREHRTELAKTEAEINQVLARLEQLSAGPTQKEIDVAQSAVASANDMVNFARARHKRNGTLFSQKLISQNDFDTTREQLAAAENSLAEARSKLHVLQAGTRPEEIEAARAEHARLLAVRDYVRGQIARVEVRSPASGVITTPTRQLHALARSALERGDLIAKVHDLAFVVVEASVPEKEIADVKVGQVVGVKVRAYPERVFRGEVVAIAPATQEAATGSSDGSAGESSEAAGNASPRGTNIRVTTLIDNSDALLKPGMTGMAKIYCGERRIIDLVLRRASRTFRVEFWSWW